MVQLYYSYMLSNHVFMIVYGDDVPYRLIEDGIEGNVGPYQNQLSLKNL